MGSPRQQCRREGLRTCTSHGGKEGEMACADQGSWASGRCLGEGTQEEKVRHEK